MADKAMITPNVLKWARESARISLETAAKKIPVLPEKLEEWELGHSHPTINQAQILAKAYKRPFALFFLPDIPKDFQPLQDFRRPGSLELSTASVFIIREIQQKQAWIADVLEDNGESALPFIGKFTIKNNPVDVAENILSTLGITAGDTKNENTIKFWISKAESKGIFISRTSFIHSKLKLDSNEIQGFAIADPHAPFVFINSEDWDAPQLFTLVHEIAHIWIAETGISNDTDLITDKSKLHPIELFCNEVAANALMPVKVVQGMDSSTFTSSDGIFKAAKYLGVSSLALLYRAKNLQIINSTTFEIIKTQVDKDFQDYLHREEEKKARQKEEKTGGHPSPYLLRLNKNGRYSQKSY